jgi:hypothetical protein
MPAAARPSERQPDSRTRAQRLLTCFRYQSEAERRAVRTTDAVERHFLEASDAPQDKTSMDRILFGSLLPRHAPFVQFRLL